MESTKGRIVKRWGSLKAERSSWLDHWKEISEYLLPRSGRFMLSDQNKGEKRHGNIYDNTATRALRVLAAGFMAGMTSPARPWFRLSTGIPELDNSYSAKVWLSSVSRLMLQVFAQSNTYRALHSIYEEIGAFATAAAVVVDDYENVIHSHTLTAGEYCIAQDALGAVNTLYREMQMTVGQLVEEYGKQACSLAVRNLWDRGEVDSWVPVLHAIEPRSLRVVGGKGSRNMPFASVCLEQGGDGDKLLRESGYEMFPALVPRWSLSGGDIYGNGPGMEALGDIKQLQHEQLRKAEGIDYQVKPPLQVPTATKARNVDTLPGGLSFVDMMTASSGVKTMFDSRIDLRALLEDIQDVRERIKASFYADLFLLLTYNDTLGSRMTATEVAERREEKLLMLGPVLERMHNELLSPLVEMTFIKMLRAGIVPPAPPELQGMELRVEFISMLAQAQRAIAANGVDRFVGSLGVIAQMKPDVLDKLDADYWADSYSDMLGVDPVLIVPGDRVALIRQQRAEQQQALQQQAVAAQAAETAAKLGSINTQEQTAYTDVMRAFSGYT